MMIDLQKAPWPDWEIVRKIGQGSFGTVYEIQRKLVDDDMEKAALKVLSIPQNPGDVKDLYDEGFDDESITATFNAHLKSIVTEYSMMRKMDGSANIVNCKDIRYIQHDDGIGWDIYIRMELLTPLMDALPMNAPEDVVIQVAKDMCAALIMCKKHEIIHRDIKPQNIFVSANGDYKLGDFGIAKTVERTTGGTKIGTYQYMAPEVFNNQPYGSGADIYSLGLVLYWLLNERRMPFMPLPPVKLKVGQREEARDRRLAGEAIPAPAHGSDELKRIVLKACAYDQKDRYASAAEMLGDLNRLGSGAGCLNLQNVPAESDTKAHKEETGGTNFAQQADRMLGEEDLDKTVGIMCAHQTAMVSGEEDLDKTVGAAYAQQVSAMPAEEDLDKTVGITYAQQSVASENTDLKKTVETTNVQQVDIVPEEDLDKTVGIAYAQQADVKPVKIDREPTAAQQADITSEEDLDKTVGITYAQQADVKPAKVDRKPVVAQQADVKPEKVDRKPEARVVPKTEQTKNSTAAQQKKKIAGIIPLIAVGILAVIVVLLMLRSCDRNEGSNNPPVDPYQGQLSAQDSTAGTVDNAMQTEGTVPVQLEWSEWTQKLPEYVTEANYVIENDTLYSTRVLETTSSTKESTMNGWELFDTVEAGSGFGVWSDWSDTKPKTLDTRQIDDQVRYRYRTKETTTGTSATKSGWTKYDTTVNWGEYGAWSKWSTDPVKESDSRKVDEPKVQYRCRTITTKTEYKEGAWSKWQDTKVEKTELRNVRERVVYPYYYYYCTKCGPSARSPYWGNTRCETCGEKSITKDTETIRWFESPWSKSKDGENGKKYQYIGGELYWNWTSGSAKTQYQYCTKELTQVKEYGSWSEWGDKSYKKSDTLDVQTRTLYRYCERSKVTTYHFWRWSSWSSWFDSKKSFPKDCDVGEATFYRYRDQVKETTYYFRRWSDWSEYSDTNPGEVEGVESKEVTVYRYKSKTA